MCVLCGAVLVEIWSLLRDFWDTSFAIRKIEVPWIVSASVTTILEGGMLFPIKKVVCSGSRLSRNGAAEVSTSVTPILEGGMLFPNDFVVCNGSRLSSNGTTKVLINPLKHSGESFTSVFAFLDRYNTYSRFFFSGVGVFIRFDSVLCCVYFDRKKK